MRYTNRHFTYLLTYLLTCRGRRRRRRPAYTGPSSRTAARAGDRR